MVSLWKAGTYSGSRIAAALLFPPSPQAPPPPCPPKQVLIALPTRLARFQAAPDHHVPGPTTLPGRAVAPPGLDMAPEVRA